MTAADALAIAQDYETLSGYVTGILGDPNISLTAAQTQRLTDCCQRLTQYANSVAIATALSALSASQGDIDKIKKATSDANVAVAKLKSQIAKINTVMQIVGDAVSLGAAIVSGPLTGVMAAATTLANDAG
jgi:hypothetical protein